MQSLAVFSIIAFIGVAFAKNVVITVTNGGNGTNTVFSPQSATANAGDVVMFTFTQGNHTATQSTFGSPCVPIHITNSTINGFDSSFRDAGNGDAITTLQVPIDDPNTPIWFYDQNTCSQGGVGAININETSTETLDGFIRNAMRLNGTTPSATSSQTQSSGSSTSSTPTPINNSGGTQSTYMLGGIHVLAILFGCLVVL